MKISYLLLAATALVLLAAFPSLAEADNCFPHPSVCGFPDATNTGVPSGTTLTKQAGPLTVLTDGATLNAIDLTGKVTIDANNVTIENSKLHTTAQGQGSMVIEVEGDNFTLRNSEISGNNLAQAPQYGIFNPNSHTVAVEASSLHGVPDIIGGGNVTVTDSYLFVNQEYTGSSDEDIYACGSPVTVDHSTLFNKFKQTAAIFGDCGDQGVTSNGYNALTLTNSMIAGGGYMLSPNAKGLSGGGVPAVVKNNRFDRIVCKKEIPLGNGFTCDGSGIKNNDGYWPEGGFNGYASGSWDPLSIWSRNKWDSNLSTVPAPF